MAESPIGQRLKFLIKELGLDVATFSKTIGVGDTTVRNYFNRGSKPNAEFFEKLVNTFESVNLNWLLSGEGRLFLTDSPTPLTQTNISGDRNNVASGKNGKAVQKNYGLPDCEKERDVLRAERDSLAKQVELLHGQLKMQETIIQGKDQMLEMLRGGTTRPN